MSKKQKMHIKIGDNVQVIAGFEKEKSGEIIKVFPNNGTIIVKGVNLKFKHIKPNQQGEVGEIKQIEAPIHHSNVKIIKNY